MAKCDNSSDGYFSSRVHYKSERDIYWSDILSGIQTLNNHSDNEHVFEPVHRHEGGIGFYLHGRGDRSGEEGDRFMIMRFNDADHWNLGFRSISQWPSFNYSFEHADDEFPIFFKEIQLQVLWTSKDYLWTKAKCKKYEKLIMEECLGYKKTREKLGFSYKQKILKRKHEIGLLDRNKRCAVSQ